MKTEVIIDGYNFLRARSGNRLKSGPGNLERARDALLRWLAKNCTQTQNLTVVFDAAREYVPLAEKGEQIRHGVSVRFARFHPDADALIAELVAKHHFPKQLIVVSNDREVQKTARRRRAQPMACEAFETLLLHQNEPSQAKKENDVKTSRPSSTERDYWLDIFGNLDAQSLVIDDAGLPPIPAPAPKSSISPEPPIRLRLPSEPPVISGSTEKSPSPTKRSKKSALEPPDSTKKPLSFDTLADFYREMLDSEKR